MEVAWCEELCEPVIVTDVVKLDETPDIYIRTPDAGYIILSVCPLKIMKTNIQEVAMYPISSVHMLSDKCPDELLHRFETLAINECALENDEVIAEALGLEYIKWEPRSLPHW